MVREAIKKATELQRREHVPPENRTDERTKAADWIEDHILAEDRWPAVTIGEISEESGWSRQHIANVLDAYFEPADAPEGLTDDGRTMGYRQGFRDGVEFVTENPEQFGLRRE